MPYRCSSSVKMGFKFEIVRDDLLSDLKRQVRLVKRHADAVCESNAPDSCHARAHRQTEMLGHIYISRDHGPVD